MTTFSGPYENGSPMWYDRGGQEHWHAPSGVMILWEDDAEAFDGEACYSGACENERQIMQAEYDGELTHYAPIYGDAICGVKSVAGEFRHIPLYYDPERVTCGDCIVGLGDWPS